MGFFDGLKGLFRGGAVPSEEELERRRKRRKADEISQPMTPVIVDSTSFTVDSPGDATSDGGSSDSGSDSSGGGDFGGGGGFDGAGSSDSF
jgi:hypothetical protein